jgi:hypothetical protein
MEALDHREQKRYSGLVYIESAEGSLLEAGS